MRSLMVFSLNSSASFSINNKVYLSLRERATVEITVEFTESIHQCSRMGGTSGPLLPDGQRRRLFLHKKRLVLAENKNGNFLWNSHLSTD